jgi:hypothetical protein
MQLAQADMTGARNGPSALVLSHTLKTRKGVCAVTDSKSNSNSNGTTAYRLFAAALMMVMLSIGVLQLAGVIRI